MFDKQKKGLRLAAYFTMKNFFKLHVAPLEVASKNKLKHKESKTPNIKKQSPKHKKRKRQMLRK